MKQYFSKISYLTFNILVISIIIFMYFLGIKLTNIYILNTSLSVFNLSKSNSNNLDTCYSYYDSAEYHKFKLDLSNEKYKNLYLSKLGNTKQKNLHLHEDFKYKSIDTFLLKKYLHEKNSLLADEPYFSTIIQTAEEFNINPLLLFAISGQEQGFVPKNSSDSIKIANNPFNVFHSWQNYNTNIKDSSEIVSRTVANLSLNRPESVDPFIWLNQKYSEDKSWFKGVKSIYSSLEQSVPYVQ